MRTESEVKAKLEELKQLHYEAVGKYQESNTLSNLLNIESLYGRIRSLEWMLDLQ